MILSIRTLCILFALFCVLAPFSVVSGQSRQTISKHIHLVPDDSEQSLSARFATSYAVIRCRIVSSTPVLIDDPYAWPIELSNDPRASAPNVATKHVVTILEVFKGAGGLTAGA